MDDNIKEPTKDSHHTEAKTVVIYERNADGDTALHLAISRNADFDLLRLLLMNGSSVTIMNNDGYTPLQLIDVHSSDTILNLLRLEHLIDYRGGVGNTILHLMMTTNSTEPQTWRRILEEFQDLMIDFNAQNVTGYTPLHTSASTEFGSEDLAFILSHFENLNLLLTDQNGDTFLHILLAATSVDTDFLNYLLKGMYKYCPSEIVKQILRSRNSTGHSPLHIFISHKNLENRDLLEQFVNAGSMIDSNNVYGENIMHALVRWCDNDEADVVDYAITNGGNVNARNGFGETPIFLTSSSAIFRVLLDAGADLKVRNKVGKTPLMQVVLKMFVELEVIEMFLVRGADVNAVDSYGNSVLHFAAWNDTTGEVVNLLKQYGAICVPDMKGQLPCRVAQDRGLSTIMKELCNCGNDHAIGFVFEEEIIQGLFNEDLDLTNDSCIHGIAQHFKSCNISENLRIPYIGSVLFETDAEVVATTVREIVENICQEIGRRDVLLANKVIQTGSVAENTKVGLPDEFDFVCQINLLSSICEVDEIASMDDPGFAYLKIKPEFRRTAQYRDLFNAYCYLSSEHVRQRFIKCLESVIQDPILCSHPNVIMEYGQFKESQLAPNCQFSLRWTSCGYKDIQINVDLVPACRIKNWWPQNVCLHDLACNAGGIRNEGALLLFQTAFDEDYEQVTKLRISAQTAEKMYMTSLPQIARDTYMVSKILCDKRVCPRVQLLKDEGFASLLKPFITSYMLKNCLFHVFQNYTNQSTPAADAAVSDTSVLSSQKLHEYVCKLFRTFKHFLQNETLPSFVFPWQDILTFQENSVLANDTHTKCACRLVYTKLILTFLGDEEDFSDIDKTLFEFP